jgi:hypothetical protein
MKFAISAVAFAAFVLHSLFGCALHAHAEKAGHCAEQAIEDDCEHGHASVAEEPIEPCDDSDHGSHVPHCNLMAVVKVQTPIATTFQLLPAISPLIVQSVPRLSDMAPASHIDGCYRGALRSHLAKSVQLN